MYTIEDLKKICNYKELNNSISVMSFPYVEMESSDDDYLLRETKRKVRNNKINEILDIDMYMEDIHIHEDKIIDYSLNNIPTISPVLKSINIKGIKYNSIDDIYLHVIGEIYNITKSITSNIPNHVIKNEERFSYFENSDINFRKIITKINYCISQNAYKSREGIGRSYIIISRDIMHLFDINSNRDDIASLLITNCDIIFSEHVSKNRIIVTTVGGISSAGIHLFNDINSKLFYFCITPGSDAKRISYFDIVI